VEKALAQLFISLGLMRYEVAEVLSFKPEFKSDAGSRRCQQLLTATDAAATLFGFPSADRSYRSEFTKNYRALFPNTQRNYRTDVLEAALDCFCSIVVNGDTHQFRRSVVTAGQELAGAWRKLMAALQTYANRGMKEPTLDKWRSILEADFTLLDQKWAEFEKQYIYELIAIEKKARLPVVELAQVEMQLHSMEMGIKTPVKYRDLRASFVRKVFRLNSIANTRRKGRDDFTVDILDCCEDVITLADRSPDHYLAAVSALAQAARQALRDFRCHLRALHKTPERIDPHLQNNTQIVKHLVRIEETWEIAHKYLRCPAMTRHLIELVDYMLRILDMQKRCLRPHQEAFKRHIADTMRERTAQERATLAGDGDGAGAGGGGGAGTGAVCGGDGDIDESRSLEDKMIECDVEALLIMPRLVCLYVLTDPHRIDVLKAFIPHLFPPDQKDDGSHGVLPGVTVPPALSGVVDTFNVCQAMFVLDGYSWDVFYTFVISRFTGCGAHTQVRDSLRERLEALFHEVETLSMTLQRHTPNEWNEFMQVCLKCLKHKMELSARKAPSPSLTPSSPPIHPASVMRPAGRASVPSSVAPSSPPARPQLAPVRASRAESPAEGDDRRSRQMLRMFDSRLHTRGGAVLPRVDFPQANPMLPDVLPSTPPQAARTQPRNR